MLRILFLAMFALSGAALSAQAQPWPTRPVRALVPFPPAAARPTWRRAWWRKN